MKMDHHCPWINNCCGYQNHASFTLFLFLAPLGCIHASFIFIMTMYTQLYNRVRKYRNIFYFFLYKNIRKCYLSWMDNLFLGVWDSSVSWKDVCGIPCCCFIMYLLLKLQRAPQCSLVGEGIRKILFSFFFFFQLFVIITGSFLELCIHWKLILSSTLYIPTRCVLAGTESICCSFPIHKLDAIYFLVACYFFLELYHFLQGKANLLCFWNCKQIMLNLF